ncbi:MAG: hypothetical protein MIO92_06855, partial [Methanosarcinaceae archaeon]|nr:hypothetical protein [Methanosarcinaceae archaeon]
RKPVSGSKELVALVRENAPGSNTLLKVWRNGAPLYMSAILGPRPPDAKGTPAPLPPPPPTKGKPKETPEELKSKEMAKQEQKTASAPSLVVHGISIKPSPVPAGQKFTVEVEFTVTDPAVKAEKVPVQFRFAILSGPKVIKKEKPISVNAYNGSTTQQIKPMSTKTTTKGAYTIQVSLKYKDMVKKDSVDLTIQ